MDKTIPRGAIDKIIVDDDPSEQQTVKALERTRDELEEFLRRRNADLARANEETVSYTSKCGID